MAKLTPYIFSEDAQAQAQFYVKALGGEILNVSTFGQLPDASEALKDKVMHLDMIAAGLQFFMCDCPADPPVHGNVINLNLEFGTEAEARQAFERLAEGGIVKHPLKQEFWGSLFGQIEDKFGVHWMITSEAKPAQP
ncbi:hypothetical protein PAESOLCIP111_03398 [Paenibacillus solanacearum]|uniref:Glyoxalase/fosfomycin resistance/dioxygenase domain-containing protein n=1 Tax=Paenibacillus solanacearum TaxID=2048548 RepID=A0A916K2G5_9BACL|nr:VOC family protein [Paenibacillus solanacearum]CAG7632622.1 hypothetical protein PAESOLCIP111_03398 [Paenibacillus solanacearum]